MLNVENYNVLLVEEGLGLDSRKIIVSGVVLLLRIGSN